MTTKGEEFRLTDLMNNHVAGMVTEVKGDGFAIASSERRASRPIDRSHRERKPTAQEMVSRYNLGKNYADWVIGEEQG